MRLWFENYLNYAGETLSGLSVLFVFGVLTLALGRERLERAEVEIAARPMRSFALGVVGAIAGIALVVMLCVTVIGIPVALCGLMIAIFAGYMGATAVLVVLGRSLSMHWSQSPYVHLAIGCFVALVVGLVPFIGRFALLFLSMTGFGAALGCRFFGYWPKAKPQYSAAI